MLHIKPKSYYISLLFCLTSLCLSSCLNIEPTESKAHQKKQAPISNDLIRIMDSHGRPTFNLVNKKTHDLSDIISSFKEFKIEKFSILNSSGEIYFESAGGLPQWSNFSLPIEKKPHLLMIKTSDGKVYKKFL